MVYSVSGDRQFNKEETVRKSIFALLFVGLMLSSVSSASAWTHSFRSSATGGVFRDDFDNDTDPIFLLDNTNWRLYTNLSNLTTNREEIFGDLTDDIYLLGISGDFRNLCRFLKFKEDWRMRSAFLFELSNARRPGNVSLDLDIDGLMDIWGEGYLSGQMVKMSDVDGDNIYDTKFTSDMRADRTEIFKSRDWLFNQGLDNGTLKLGLKVVHYGFGDNYFETNTSRGAFQFAPVAFGDPSFTKDVRWDSLSTGEAFRKIVEKGEFSTIEKTPTTSFVLAGERKLTDKLDVRLDLGFDKVTKEHTVNDFYTYSWDESSGDTIIDRWSEWEKIKVDDPRGGNLVSLSNLETYHWNGDVYTEIGLGIRFGTLDVNLSDKDDYSYSKEGMTIAGNVYESTRTYSCQTTDKGDNKVSNLIFRTRTEAKLGERLRLGMAMFLDYSPNEVTSTRDFSEREVRAYDDGDEVPDDVDDYTRTITGSYKADVTIEDKQTVVTLPVGLEYGIDRDNRWVLRVGAVHRIDKRVLTTEELVKEKIARKTETVYGDGTVITTIDDLSYLSSKESRETLNQTTAFMYGLGWRATKNLQVDLLGFWGTGVDPNAGAGDNESIFDSNFYRSLKLSLTLKF